MAKHWTDKEKRYLKEHYNVAKIEVIAEILERTPQSIRSQVNYLRKRGWTFNRKRDE
jgi:Mn-dependent DtxR family transcriptional regulator|tara:strand:+ start:491 stop:661 length:171 start_codon:yes stop_codon:yes gene_type:complete